MKEQLEKARILNATSSINYFEIQKYHQNEPKFDGVYSINKGGAYVINLDDFKSIGSHWITLSVNGNDVTYFDSFGVEHITKKIKKFVIKLLSWIYWFFAKGKYKRILTNMKRMVK